MNEQVTDLLAEGELSTVAKGRSKPWPRVELAGYSYLLPAIVMIGVFVYYGIIFNFDTSFYDWDGISPHRAFLGFGNYLELIGDRDFGQALINTLIWGVLCIGVMTFFGFLLATLMTTNVRFKGLLSSIIVIPSVTATVVVAIITRQILGGTDGQFNELLNAIGLGAFSSAWLGNPGTALYGLAAANIWQWTGFSFLLFYSALTLVNQEVVEAAYLDGASLWQVIWRILFPLCRPTTYGLVILGAIQALKTFDIVYLTTNGGPGRATEVISTYIFHKAMLDSRAGYSAALSIVLVVLALIATASFLWLQQRRTGDV